MLRDFARGGVGIILISDDIGELLSLCGASWLLRRGRIAERLEAARLTEAGLASRLVRTGRDPAIHVPRMDPRARHRPPLRLDRAPQPGLLHAREPLRSPPGSTVTGLFAIGVLVVLISGGIDVSFTAIAAFSMYATVRILNRGRIRRDVLVPAALSAAIGLGWGW